MHHKQQLSSSTSHGLKSVGHASSENSTVQNRADTQHSCGSAQDPAQLARGRARVLQQLRCEALGSLGPDPTGEAATTCGARADVVCESCGPLCLRCAEETFCFYGEHRLTPIKAVGRDAGEIAAPKPLFRVVYIQLSCPNCGHVRVALPAAANPRSGIELACPECAAAAVWRYLAHGLTQRELPFYERFTLDEETEEEIATKPRLPWDRRGKRWEE